MALPFRHIRDEHKPGYIDIDQYMMPDTADKEHDERSPEYLGAGSYGIAVEYPSGHVGKYTVEQREITFARYLAQNPIPCFVRVFAVRRVQSKPELLWIIEMEKVQVLSKEDKLVYQVATITFNNLLKKDTLTTKENFIQECIRYGEHPEAGDIYRGAVEQIKKDPRIVLSFWDLSVCVRNNDIIMKDMHCNNIGWNSDGRLVAFDFAPALPETRIQDIAFF